MGKRINSEDKSIVVETEVGLPLTNQCILVMQQGTLGLDDAAPIWRVSAAVVPTGAPSELAQEPIPFLLPVLVGPLIKQRAIVAIAKFPGDVQRWRWTFESDHPRATAEVWLLAGESQRGPCGLFPVPFPPVDLSRPW
jgi:hypothetical protein